MTYYRYEIVKIFRKHGIPYSYNENMDIMYKGFNVMFNTYSGYIFFALPMDKYLKSKRFDWQYHTYINNIEREYNNRTIQIKVWITPNNFRKRMLHVNYHLETINDLYSKYEDMYLGKIARLQTQIGLLEKLEWTVRRRPHGTNDWEIKKGNIVLLSESMENIYNVEILDIGNAGSPLSVSVVFETLDKSLERLISRQKLNKEIDAWITTKIREKNEISQ